MIFFVPLAMPLNQLFEVMFDSSVVVKYPIFWTQKAKNRCACWNPCAWRTFWLFWMKVQNPGRMFEIAERNFNAPSPVIAFPDIVQSKWEGKVGNEIFICILSGFDLNNAKLQEIKMTVFFPEKLIKMRGIFTGIDVAVNIWWLFIIFVALSVKKRFIVTSNSSRSSGSCQGIWQHQGRLCW